MITLNTYAGEWPDTDDHPRTIVDTVLGDVPCVPLATCRPIKTLVRELQIARFSGS
jgi:hypothetical protein